MKDKRDFKLFPSIASCWINSHVIGNTDSRHAPYVTEHMFFKTYAARIAINSRVNSCKWGTKDFYIYNNVSPSLIGILLTSFEVSKLGYPLTAIGKQVYYILCLVLYNLSIIKYIIIF